MPLGEGFPEFRIFSTRYPYLALPLFYISDSRTLFLLS